MIFHPSRSFRVCPEPIDHGRVIRFLATVRLLPWVALVGVLGYTQLTAVEGMGVPMRAIYVFIEPSLAQVLSMWIVMMIPVGLPLLYFVSGLTGHIGVALTGGASRSIGASMRACGYVSGLVLLVIGVVDIPLYLGWVPGPVYIGVLGVQLAGYWGLAGLALARSHQVSVARGIIAALLPTLMLGGVTVARASLELAELPGIEVPTSPYALP
ncbi:MAG: hypothetical protein AAF799_09305 [Myxococcota bacterium]